MAESGKFPDDNNGDDTSKSFSSAISENVISDVEEANFFNHGRLVNFAGESFVCKAVEGDGSCFFHAVIDQLDFNLSDHGWNHISLRQAAVLEMREHPEIYMELLGVTSIEEYNKILDEWEKLETFVDHPIVQATAVVLGCPIVMIKFQDSHRYGSIAEPPETDSTNGMLCLGLENAHYWSLRLHDGRDLTSRETSGQSAGSSNSNNNNSNQLKYQHIKMCEKVWTTNIPNRGIRMLNLSREWRIIDEERTECLDEGNNQRKRRISETNLDKLGGGAIIRTRQKRNVDEPRSVGIGDKNSIKHRHPTPLRENHRNLKMNYNKTPEGMKKDD